MPALPPLHPVLVHFPIVLLIVSVLFEIVGRLIRQEWVRNAAFALLILGALGAGAAVFTGGPAGDAAERQGANEHAVDEHEEAGQFALYLAIGAVVARAVAGRTGPARGFVGGLGFALHLAAALAVSLAGFRGGKLVFEQGAGVRVHGTLVPSDGPPRPAEPGEKP